LKDLSDEDLMEQFQSGTLDAFNELVDRFSDRLKYYLRGFIKDERRCEDLLQETFLRVYRNRFSYRRVAKFSTWLYTVAGNLARSEYRRQRRWQLQSIHGTTRDGAEEYERPILSSSLAPDDYVESQIQDKHIQDALDQIPDIFRELVILRDIQNLTYEQMVEITGLPMGTVKSRINRGRLKLQKLLEDIYPYEELSLN
jgi:RNA polymerase sigma-70 factor (ECF subfamily)